MVENSFLDHLMAWLFGIIFMFVVGCIFYLIDELKRRFVDCVDHITGR